MKATALEWFANRLTERGLDYSIEDFEQAKKMERDQIITAHGDKQKIKSNPGSLVSYGYWYKGEDYFNDNFNKITDEN